MKENSYMRSGKHSRRFRYEKRYQRQRLIIYLVIFLILGILISFIFSFGLFAWYAKDLPSPGKLSQASGYSSVFYDREGKILFKLYKDKNRIPVKLNQISPYLIKATISIEDKDFYKHKGISEKGILRAVISTILKRRLEGGSTITQQLIKNVLLDPRRTISRKIKEMILAIEVERRYTKDQILEMYLNEAPYGGSFWGVESAAKGYFNKSAADLNLVESAILAGLPQRPSYFSPYIGKKDAWKSRAKSVLRRMREDDYITEEEEEKAKKQIEKIVFRPPKIAIRAPHFVFYVKREVEKLFGEKIFDKGIKVKTTLSLDLQEKAEQIVNKEIRRLKRYKVSNGAVVVIDTENGEILSMVGSYNFNDPKYGKFNAALGLRQPGSAIKPITYTVAFEKGYTPATVVMDVKTVFPDQGGKDYIPVNYDGKYRGPMQLRFALGNSINVVAVKLLAMVGVKNFLQKASEMGLTTFAPTKENLSRFGLAITLGGGETTLLDLTNAFSVYGRGGIYKKPRSLLEITDYQGKVLYKPPKPKERRVVSSAVAFLISHILSDNNARKAVFGPNSYLRIPGKTVAVKTGTTNDKRDNWAVGFTRGVTVGVWVGNNDNQPMNKKIASGLTGASPIWRKVILETLKRYPDGIIDKPENVKALQIDAYLGGLPKEGYPVRSEYFIQGTEPKEVSPFYKKLKISKNTEKLANEVEIKLGQYEEKEYIVFTEEDPVSKDGKNRWQEGINQWLSQQTDPKLHPPTEVSDFRSGEVVVSIKNPKNKETVHSNKVRVKAKIASLKPIKRVEVYFNDSLTFSYDGDQKKIDEEFELSDGSYQLKIVALNTEDKRGEGIIRFGVNKPWDYQEISPTTKTTPTAATSPTQEPTPTPVPENTLTPTVTPILTPTP